MIEYVPEELAETAEKFKGALSPDMYLRLRQCNARLDVMSAKPVQPEITDNAITVHAQTDLDPKNAEVAAILVVLAKLVNGFVVDCVNGGLLPQFSTEWLLDE